MTRNSKNNIKSIDYCLSKIDQLSLLKEQDKNLLKNRLILLKKLANKRCFSDDDCEFQIVIYSYSIIEFLAKKYFKINSESYFDIDFSLLPQKIYKNVDLIRKYRHHVHIKDSNDAKVSSDDCISCLTDVFKYFTEPNDISFNIVLLLGDADLNNRYDVKLLKSLNIQPENYNIYINAYKILSIPKRQITEDEYSIALVKFEELFYVIFNDKEYKSYSTHLIGRFLYSLTFFKKEDTKELIEKFLKKGASFFQVCGEFISYVVELFPEETIKYLKVNIKSFSKTTIENSNWLDRLLYSLVVVSNDNNIVDVLYLILSFYDNSEEDKKVLKRATDMLWPGRPQTKANLDNQYNAVFKLFNGSIDLSNLTIFTFLPYLLKGFYKNNKIYINYNNQAIGLFEDGQNHAQEIEKQFDKYYDYIFKKSIKFPDLLHILLNNIKSFDNTILYKLIKDINTQFDSIPKTYNILNDLKTLFISLDRSDKGYIELEYIIKELYPELVDNKCIEIANQYNNKKTIHRYFSKCIKEKPNYYITQIINLLNNPYNFGELISKKYNANFDEIVFLLLGRKQDKILAFLKGYINFNFNIIDRLFSKAKDDTQKLNLLFLYNFDQDINAKLIGLRKKYRIIYWQNFNSETVNPFIDLNTLNVIVKNLIDVGYFILALEIIENCVSLNDKLLDDASFLSLSVKLLFIIANNFSINIEYNWDINYISQNAKIHNKICFLLDKIERKKISYDLYQLEYIFADRKMDFNPSSTGYYLQKSPCDLIHLFENKNIIALLAIYWNMPPGFSKSGRFYIDKFNRWFNEYETIKSKLMPNDIKKVSSLLCHSYANGPFSHPRKEIINKLNELGIDWNYFAFNYIEHLKSHFELHIYPEKINEISDILQNFISFLKKNNFGDIATIIKREGKEYLSKKVIIKL